MESGEDENRKLRRIKGLHKLAVAFNFGSAPYARGIEGAAMSAPSGLLLDRTATPIGELIVISHFPSTAMAVSTE